MKLFIFLGMIMTNYMKERGFDIDSMPFVCLSIFIDIKCLDNLSTEISI